MIPMFSLQMIPANLDKNIEKTKAFPFSAKKRGLGQGRGGTSAPDPTMGQRSCPHDP